MSGPILATSADPAAANFQLPNGGTIYFRLLLAAPEQSRETQLSVRHVPGGNINVVSIGGLMPLYIRGQALFSSYADFVNMFENGLAQPPNAQPGTLTYSEATASAFLTKISRQKVPNSRLGYMVATVEFLVDL